MLYNNHNVKPTVDLQKIKKTDSKHTTVENTQFTKNSSKWLHKENTKDIPLLSTSAFNTLRAGGFQRNLGMSTLALTG